MNSRMEIIRVDAKEFTNRFSTLVQQILNTFSTCDKVCIALSGELHVIYESVVKYNLNRFRRQPSQRI